jgi:RsiW-degrading membrane proteinase PrsW (M82 family)
VISVIWNALLLLAPTAVLMWLWHAADRRDGAPALSLRAFGAGALAVPIALLLGWGVLALMGVLGLVGSSAAGGSGPGASGALWMFQDPDPPTTVTAQLLHAFVVAGVVEEAVKLLAVLVVAHRALRRHDGQGFVHGTSEAPAGQSAVSGISPSRGPVLLRHGAAAGVGFGVVEAAAQLVGSAQFVLLRVIMVIPLHAALTGIAFVFAGGAIVRRSRGKRAHPGLTAVAMVVLAAGVHGVFNLLVGPLVVGAAMIVAAVLIVAIVTNGVVVSENPGSQTHTRE